MTITFLCLFAYKGVQHILRCVFGFLCLVCPMVPVSLDCTFVIVPSVFSNVYSNIMSFVLINNSKQLPLHTWNIIRRPLHHYISYVIFRGSEIQYEHYHRAEQSRETGTKHKTKKNKTKTQHITICVAHHYTQANTKR
jgi:hypothetical protein